MLRKYFLISLLALLAVVPFNSIAQDPEAATHHHDISHPKTSVKKILFIGDSMTGWLADALNAYGKENGFEVATIVWDGSTIAKWGNNPRLASIIKSQNPDAVFVSLGMNELFETNPQAKLQAPLNNIKQAVGNLPIIWVGPPSWPGHNKGEALNDWLQKELGHNSFFRSFDLSLPRQSKNNPHPTRQGMIKWVDEIMKWAPDHSKVDFPEDIKVPSGNKMVRGKTFIYKRMKESL